MINKKSFVLFEILIAISILAIFYISIKPNTNEFKTNQFIDKLQFYIKQVRNKALIDNKFDLDNETWHKELWTIKFQRCRSSVGGIYFTIYSDKNNSGKINKEDTLKDKLTNTYMYSSNYCNESNTNNEDVLLTKNYNIQSINLTCNDTTSLGQLSFDSNSQVYSKLSNEFEDFNDYKIKNNCTIEIVDNTGNVSEIYIDGKTGYSYRM